MDFFDRVRLSVKARNTTIEDFLKDVFGNEVTRDVYNGWRKRKNLPRAEKALAIARALGTTVEYLVDGEEGAEYIRALIAEEGRLWRPPPRIEAVVRILESLDDEKLDTVKTMIGALSGEDPIIQKVQGS